jgi:hypothetical protein
MNAVSQLWQPSYTYIDKDMQSIVKYYILQINPSKQIYQLEQ